MLGLALSYGYALLRGLTALSWLSMMSQSSCFRLMAAVLLRRNCSLNTLVVFTILFPSFGTGRRGPVVDLGF